MLLLTQKLLGLLPNAYPHACIDDWLLATNDELTAIKCTCPMCVVSNAFKLKGALDLLEFRVNIGNETSLDIIEGMKLESHMHIFSKAFEEINRNNSAIWAEYGKSLSKIRQHITEVNKQGGFSLAKYMDAWGCDGIGATTNEKVFRKFKSPEDFYNQFETKEDAQRYVGEALNISPYCSTVFKFVRFLYLNKDDILDIGKYFKFKEVQIDDKKYNKTINVCITDSIIYAKDANGNYFSNRESFVPYLVDKYHLDICYNRSINKTTDFLVNDEGNRKGKWKKVKTTPSYRHCVILTSNVLEVVLEVLQGDLSGVYSANETSELQGWVD